MGKEYKSTADILQMKKHRAILAIQVQDCKANSISNDTGSLANITEEMWGFR